MMKMRPRPKEAERENAQDDPQGIPLGDQLGGVNLGQENLAVPRFPLSSQPRGSRTVEASGFRTCWAQRFPARRLLACWPYHPWCIYGISGAKAKGPRLDCEEQGQGFCFSSRRSRWA